MRQNAAIELFAGGPGSGPSAPCPQCGRQDQGPNTVWVKKNKDGTETRSKEKCMGCHREELGMPRTGLDRDEMNRKQREGLEQKVRPDHGADPLGDGKFRMVPSGDIVDLTERNKRLERFDKAPKPSNDAFGLSWEQIAIKQGGLNTLDITRPKKTRKK